MVSLSGKGFHSHDSNIYAAGDSRKLYSKVRFMSHRPFVLTAERDRFINPSCQIILYNSASLALWVKSDPVTDIDMLTSIRYLYFPYVHKGST